MQPPGMGAKKVDIFGPDKLIRMVLTIYSKYLKNLLLQNHKADSLKLAMKHMRT